MSPSSPASPASPGDLRRFLFGTASEAETEAFTLRCLSEDDALFEALADEDDLFDEYARGELDDEAARRFEEAVLGHDEGLQRLAFARDLNHRAHLVADHRSEPAESTESWLRRLLAGIATPAARPAWALCFLLLVAVTWQTARLARLEPAPEPTPANQLAEAPYPAANSAETARLEAETQDLERRLEQATQHSESLRAEIERLSVEPADAPAPGAVPQVFAVILASVTRGSRIPHFKVPQETQRVELQIDLSEGPPVDEVRARLLDDGGFQLWGLPAVETEGEAGRLELRLPVPAEILPAGSYSLRLETTRALPEGIAANESTLVEPLEVAVFDFRVDDD